MKWHRPLPEGAKVGAAVLSRSNGRWFIYFQIEVGTQAIERPVSTVGIDLGLSSLVALSTGEMIPAPQWTKPRRQRAAPPSARLVPQAPVLGGLEARQRRRCPSSGQGRSAPP